MISETLLVALATHHQADPFRPSNAQPPHPAPGQTTEFTLNIQRHRHAFLQCFLIVIFYQTEHLCLCGPLVFDTQYRELILSTPTFTIAHTYVKVYACKL